ncbi:CRISPR-associated protein Cas5 [Tistrella mobilis]
MPRPWRVSAGSVCSISFRTRENPMRYPVVMEVAGPLAMFARPDTGLAPTSYPAPTSTACKGMFEAIAMFADGRAWFSPRRVEICRPVGSPGGRIRFQRYTTSYAGPLRKSALVRADQQMQVMATVLADVCYRLHADVEGEPPRGGQNPAHHLQDLFLRRLKRGQCFRTPALGWREFTCSYWGTPRDGYEVDDGLDLTLPSMLTDMWDQPCGGRYRPRFAQNLCIRAGVLSYAQ